MNLKHPDPIQSDEPSIAQLNEKAWELRRSEINESYTLASEAHQRSTRNNDEQGLADSCRTLGYCYWQFADYALALEYSLDALKRYEQLNDKKGQADTVSSLGAVYAFMGDDKKRLEYNLHSLKLRQEIGDTEGESITLNNIGDTYMKLGDYDKALEYFYRCLHMPEASDHNKAIVLLNIGELKFLSEEYSESIKFLLESASLSTTHGFTRFLIAADMLIGQVYTASGDFTNAESFLNKALTSAEKVRNKEYLYDIYKALAYLEEKRNNYKEAYAFFRKYHSLRSEVMSESLSEKIKNIQLHHRIVSARKEVELEKVKNEELNEAYRRIEGHRNEILEKNKQITDSITYARRIQDAILPKENHWSKILTKAFIFYQPKDIVSGDFYWIEKIGNNLVIAAVDCTGHGVPGAFMSIIGHNLLNQIVREQNITSPEEILNHLETGINEMLQYEGTGGVKDGMDISVIRYNDRKKELLFSGGNQSAYLFADGELVEIKGDKKSIGNSYGGDVFKPYSLHEINIKGGEVLYLFSDGVADQFGGPKGKKFKYRQLKELLSQIHLLPMNEQKKKIASTIDLWKSDHEQVDDMLVIGISF